MSIIPEAVLKIKAMKPQRDPVSHHQRVRRPAMIAHSGSEGEKASDDSTLCGSEGEKASDDSTLCGRD